jgi:hypothetical protein
MKSESKAKVKTISASFRISTKINNEYFTLEYKEERSIPPAVDKNLIDMERQLLWDTVIGETERQVDDLIKYYKK